MDIAVDNCVISHYLEFIIGDSKTNEQRKDLDAFSEIIHLSEQKIFELGGPISTLWIENCCKSYEMRKLFKEKLGHIIKFWPVCDPFPAETNKRMKCLNKILQDKNDDYKQIVIIAGLSQSRHLLTMDKKLCNQFNDKKSKIIRECGINMFVMRPSELLAAYNGGKI